MVIIGGVAAGMSTAAKLRRVNSKATIETTVLEEDEIISYSQLYDFEGGLYAMIVSMDEDNESKLSFVS